MNSRVTGWSRQRLLDGGAARITGAAVSGRRRPAAAFGQVEEGVGGEVPALHVDDGSSEAVGSLGAHARAGRCAASGGGRLPVEDPRTSWAVPVGVPVGAGTAPSGPRSQ